MATISNLNLVLVPTSPRTSPPDDDPLLARIAELEAQVAVRDQQVRDLNEYVVEIKEDLASHACVAKVKTLTSDLSGAADHLYKWHQWSRGLVAPEDLSAGVTTEQLKNLACAGLEKKDQMVLLDAFGKGDVGVGRDGEECHCPSWTDAKWGAFVSGMVEHTDSNTFLALATHHATTFGDWYDAQEAAAPGSADGTFIADPEDL